MTQRAEEGSCLSPGELLRFDDYQALDPALRDNMDNRLLNLTPPTEAKDDFNFGDGTEPEPLQAGEPDVSTGQAVGGASDAAVPNWLAAQARAQARAQAQAADANTAMPDWSLGRSVDNAGNTAMPDWSDFPELSNTPLAGENQAGTSSAYPDLNTSNFPMQLNAPLAAQGQASLLSTPANFDPNYAMPVMNPYEPGYQTPYPDVTPSFISQGNTPGLLNAPYLGGFQYPNPMANAGLNANAMQTMSNPGPVGNPQYGNGFNAPYLGPGNQYQTPNLASPYFPAPLAQGPYAPQPPAQGPQALQPPAQGPQGQQPPAQVEGGTTHVSRKITHTRKFKSTNDPTRVYRSAGLTEAWGFLDKRGSPMFKYSPKGVELDMTKRYSADDLIKFFKGEGPPDGGPTNRTSLTIWIQNTPSQDNCRYHHGGMSSRCRWEGCIAPKGTILKGFFRVAFDELSDLTGKYLDPFLNAGYMHLYCFEKAFDMAMLIAMERPLKFRIIPDFRLFESETKNPMSLVRDHPQIEACWDEWRTTQLEKVRKHMAMGNPRAQEERKRGDTDYLWYWLTRSVLQVEGQGRKVLRQKRAGADVERHGGDLGLYLRLKAQIKSQRKESKRKRSAQEELVEVEAEVDVDEDEDEDGDGDEDGEEEEKDEADEAVVEERPRKRPRRRTARQSKDPSPPANDESRSDGQRTRQEPDTSLEARLGDLAQRRSTRKRSAEVAEVVERATQAGRFTPEVGQRLATIVEDEPSHVRAALVNRLMHRDDEGEPLTPLIDKLPRQKRRAVRAFVKKQQILAVTNTAASI